MSIEPWDVEELPDTSQEIILRTGELTKIVDDYLQTRGDSEIRKYIGASSIGHPCARKIWYGYTGVIGAPNEPQIQRTFDIGHKLEGLMLDYLEAAGLDIMRSKDFTSLRDNELFELQGHCDAIWYKENSECILEIKTARDSSFNVFVKHGLLKWYPIYYAQVQCYMGMSGIHEAYVIAINKDTSKMHDEHVVFDAPYYEHLKSKAERIIAHDEPPARINQNPCYFTCRMCNYKELCHGAS